MARRVHTISIDALWPRDEEHRYRIYGRIGRDLNVLAATATPEGVGVALATLHQDAKQVGRRLADAGQFGVLDAIAGEWIVLPYNRSTTPERTAP